MCMCFNDVHDCFSLCKHWAWWLRRRSTASVSSSHIKNYNVSLQSVIARFSWHQLSTSEMKTEKFKLIFLILMYLYICFKQEKHSVGILTEYLLLLSKDLAGVQRHEVQPRKSQLYFDYHYYCTAVKNALGQDFYYNLQLFYLLYRLQGKQKEYAVHTARIVCVFSCKVSLNRFRLAQP